MSIEINDELHIGGDAHFWIIVSQSRILSKINPLKKSSAQSANEIRTETAQAEFSWQPLTRQELWNDADLPTKNIHVGKYRGQAVCLAVIDDSASTVPMAGLAWLTLRELLPSFDDDTFLLASRSMQLYEWNRNHRFCGRCGEITRHSPTDRAWECPSCELLFYPRISPCVIGLVVDGPRVLLARGLKHRPELYSCLAGFIEPGESAEQAFAREVKEEVNLDIKNIRYHGSQTWPFPGQLMLGFYADYAGGELKVDGVEILEANWYTEDKLPEIPSMYSISGKIIRGYFASN